MFAKKEKIKTLDRLKKRSDFLRVQHADVKWVSKSMVVQVCKNEDFNKDQGFRYGITVTKRVSNLAVVRNRLKRQLKAIACDVLSEQAPAPYDIVLIGRAGMQTRTYAEIKNDFQWCLRKLDI